MRCTFRTKWEKGEIACVCTLENKCIHAKACEELDFKFDKFDGIKECMNSRSYQRKNGSLRQVRHD